MRRLAIIIGAFLAAAVVVAAALAVATPKLVTPKPHNPEFGDAAPTRPSHAEIVGSVELIPGFQRPTAG